MTRRPHLARHVLNSETDAGASPVQAPGVHVSLIANRAPVRGVNERLEMVIARFHLLFSPRIGGPHGALLLTSENGGYGRMTAAAARVTFWPRALRHAQDLRRPAVRGGAVGSVRPVRFAIARLLSGAVTTFCPPRGSAIFSLFRLLCSLSHGRPPRLTSVHL